MFIVGGLMLFIESEAALPEGCRAWGCKKRRTRASRLRPYAGVRKAWKDRMPECVARILDRIAATYSLEKER